VSRDRESERKQSQARAFVSRFEPLLYIPAFTAMKDFSMLDPARSLLYIFLRTPRPISPSHLVPQHLTTTNPQARLGRNLYNMNATKGWSSSWSPKLAYNKFLEAMWRCRSSELSIVKHRGFWEWE